jgi:hypothetical protein
VFAVSDKPIHRALLPANRGRRTRVAIADIATEADRSTVSFYNYDDSKEGS